MSTPEDNVIETAHWSDRIKGALKSGMEFAIEHPAKASLGAWAAVYLTQAALLSGGASSADPTMSGLSAAIQVGLPAAIGISGSIAKRNRQEGQERIAEIKSHYKKPVGVVPEDYKAPVADYGVEEQSLEKAVELLSADKEAWKVFSGFIAKSDEARAEVISILDAKGQEASAGPQPEIEVVHGPAAGR
ncbi:hypothetical protein [Marinobacter salarius]|uniref:Uncharacterized protein n=1 Tax=Marinobacter salarius TaxID=1420917 RepID=A0A1W6KFV5_9GAMM|nr:hypothetical protein [Marinobacter salarius]ARM86283.1 hypothetical protein MARSALSMR5_04266 [Marinobacter salarius]